MKVRVSNMVRGLVLSRPFVKSCLADGIVNYSALARLFADELEKRGVSASQAAIKMSLIRVREEIMEEEKKLRVKLKHVIGSSVIQLQSDLTVITVHKQRVLEKLAEITKIMKSARFLQLLQGVSSFTLIISSEDKEKIIQLLGPDSIIETRDDQVALVLISPKEILETPGVIALVSSTLYENDINISQIVSCYNDTIILVDSAKASEAYRALETLIKSIRTQSV
ncbi:MAG: ACT domain-containing protein [Acidilobaceae archaeon]|nr:ACT domain-containing protein [Acidilobaceae archaeon]MCX8165899.1 ACT domain-containing protein [Acidilobaceae archaeon]MDW7974541.1 ACT domain-containing protein [Sulfolobales archaeon]